MNDVAGLDDPSLLAVEVNAKVKNGTTRSNLLSLKLAEILSTSYADSNIRDALVLLDKRIQDNTPEMRRQFRANVEAEVIEANGQVLEQFSKIAMRLETIGLTISNMNSVVNEITESLSTSKDFTRELFKEEEKLSSRKHELETKRALLSSLNEHFILSDLEIEILTLSSHKIDYLFFEVVTKAKRIYDDCEVLLASENPVIGTEIMEQLSKHLDQAFNKVYYWIEREIRNLSVDDPQIRVYIRKSLGLLAERPTLFQNCLDRLSEIRQKIILQEFLTALTEGTKPIELAAYDSFRYVGDMLAWTHAETVNEKEILELLFISDDANIAHGLQEGLASEPWAGQFDLAKTIGDLTDKNMRSICKPLKSRIDQALSGQISSTLAFKICHLIEFYRSIFAKYLQEDAQLLNVLKVLETLALNQFSRAIREHVRVLQSNLPQVPKNLRPPDFLHENLNEMKELMASFDTAFAIAPQDKDQEFAKIIDQALEPILNICDAMTEGLTTTKKNIFLINSYELTKATLQLFPFTKLKLASYDKRTNQYSKVLVDNLHDLLLDQSSLRPALQAIQEKARDVPLKALEQFQENRITQLSISLDEFLPSALMDAQTYLQSLSSPRLGNRIIQEAARLFVADFSIVEKGILDSIEFPRSLFPRTTAEVKVLLVV
ncbi:oligomeric Golgi complex subunit 6, partial [Lipomyces japonicus]|uniref:oligomeric Golgi complex subunit 6 n=1 Tax=Lipomyces japonicus TaxID=56871 RepID=UPI0034CEF17F